MPYSLHRVASSRKDSRYILTSPIKEDCLHAQLVKPGKKDSHGHGCGSRKKALWLKISQTSLRFEWSQQNCNTWQGGGCGNTEMKIFTNPCQNSKHQSGKKCCCTNLLGADPICARRIYTLYLLVHLAVSGLTHCTIQPQEDGSGRLGNPTAKEMPVSLTISHYCRTRNTRQWVIFDQLW